MLRHTRCARHMLLAREWTAWRAFLRAFVLLFYIALVVTSLAVVLAHQCPLYIRRALFKCLFVFFILPRFRFNVSNRNQQATHARYVTHASFLRTRIPLDRSRQASQCKNNV